MYAVEETMTSENAREYEYLVMVSDGAYPGARTQWLEHKVVVYRGQSRQS